MSGANGFDVAVIGGGVAGLIAAAYLARAGRSVTLLESDDVLGGSCRAVCALPGLRVPIACQTLFALDPRIVEDLSLVRQGLRFAVRDVPLVGLGRDRRPLVLARDPHSASRSIAVHSVADAAEYRRFRKELFALARALRPFWWDGFASPAALVGAARRGRIAHWEASSAAALLAGRFESDAVRSVLAFDAVNPFAPGSALSLVWRAAQEMCGLQSAVAVPLGGMGVLPELLSGAARDLGVEIRTRAAVSRLELARGRVSGVTLASGESIAARAVLSSISARRTLLELAPTAGAGFAVTFALRDSAPQAGDASVMLVLNAEPALAGGEFPKAARLVIAERLDSFAAREAAVYDGALPDEIVLEVVSPTAIDASLAPAGQSLLSVRAAGLPIAPHDGWPALTTRFVEKMVVTLERHIPHLRQRIVAMDMRLPDSMPVELNAGSGARLLASYASRIHTPIAGLFLCGNDAEPVAAISGRAARLAAQMAHAQLTTGEPRP